MSKLPFEHSITKSTETLELVHTDLCELRQPSLGNGQYILTLIDNFSKFVTVYILKAKSETKDCIKKYIELTENQLGKSMKTLRSDNGREYTDKILQDFLAERGIVSQTSCPYTPAQNGVAERYNRTILDKARCMVLNAKAPKKFWAEAVHTAVHIITEQNTYCFPSTLYTV